MGDDLRTAHAVLIGVGHHTRPSDLPDIPVVNATIHQLYDLLRSRCGLAENAITPILDPATPLAIAEKIESAVAKAKGHPLIVYYLGHGLVDSQSRLYLATAGSAAGHVQTTAIPYDTIRTMLETSKISPPVVILDCCYSGKAVSDMRRSPTAFADMTGVDGGCVLTSASRDATAFVPAGANRPAFTGALLTLLQEGIPGGPPDFDLRYIFGHLKRTLGNRGLPIPQSLETNGSGARVLAVNVAVDRPVVEPVPPRRRGKVIAAKAVSAVLVAGAAVAAAILLRTHVPPPPSATTCAAAARGVHGVTVETPCDRGEVQACAVVTGTSTLPPGKTLVLAVQNLDGNHTYYYHNVKDWDEPERLARWTGQPYFGNERDGQGQEYKLTVVVTDVEVVRTADAKGQLWFSDDLIAGDVAAVITVRRSRTASPAPC